MRKFYQLLIIILVTQFSDFLYGMEDDLGNIESTNDDAIINQLNNIGKIVYKKNNGIPVDVYFEVRRDAIEVVPGKEHLETQELVLRGIQYLALGALAASAPFIAIFSGLDEADLKCSPKVIYGLLGAKVFTVFATYYWANQCAGQWQIMPQCTDIEAHSVIVPSFRYLYNEGEKLRCKVESSWTQCISYTTAFMAGLGLGVWGYLSLKRS
jgi:hypothetical protein